MTAMEEVNYWRRANRLPEFEEDPQLTEFAQMKAEYRAARRLHDGHDGPKWPQDCQEGTGEAKAMWGWLTCCMECDAVYAGAGIAVADDERYMVLVVRDPGPRDLIRNVKPIDTSFLTPDPVRVD